MEAFLMSIYQQHTGYVLLEGYEKYWPDTPSYLELLLITLWHSNLYKGLTIWFLWGVGGEGSWRGFWAWKFFLHAPAFLFTFLQRIEWHLPWSWLLFSDKRESWNFFHQNISPHPATHTHIHLPPPHPIKIKWFLPELYTNWFKILFGFKMGTRHSL